MNSDALGGAGGGADSLAGLVGRPQADVVVDAVVEYDALLGDVADAFSQPALAYPVVWDSADGDFAGGGSEQAGEHCYQG